MSDVFQFISKVFGVDEVRFHEAHFVHVAVVEQVQGPEDLLKGNCNAAAGYYTNDVLPTLWQQFGEEAHTHTLVRYPQTFGRTTHVDFSLVH